MLIQDPHKVEEIVKQRMFSGTNAKIQLAIDSTEMLKHMCVKNLMELYAFDAPQLS